MGDFGWALLVIFVIFWIFGGQHFTQEYFDIQKMKYSQCNCRKVDALEKAQVTK